MNVFINFHRLFFLSFFLRFSLTNHFFFSSTNSSKHRLFNNFDNFFWYPFRFWLCSWWKLPSSSLLLSNDPKKKRLWRLNKGKFWFNHSSPLFCRLLFLPFIYAHEIHILKFIILCISLSALFSSAFDSRTKQQPRNDQSPRDTESRPILVRVASRGRKTFDQKKNVL